MCEGRRAEAAEARSRFVFGSPPNSAHSQLSISPQNIIDLFNKINYSLRNKGKCWKMPCLSMSYHIFPPGFWLICPKLWLTKQINKRTRWRNNPSEGCNWSVIVLIKPPLLHITLRPMWFHHWQICSNSYTEENITNKTVYVKRKQIFEAEIYRMFRSRFPDGANRSDWLWSLIFSGNRIFPESRRANVWTE